jgi:branched-chain amino acid transport system permease protein
MGETSGEARNGGALSGRVGWALLPIAVTAAILAVLPPLWFGDAPYTTSLAVQALVFASYGVGFNLIFGSTNQLFLCVGALAGIGGYGAAILTERTSLPLVAGVVVGTAAAAIVGGVLSWIAVRRSLGVIFTGIVTLVFSLAFANLLLGQRDLTGSETGLVVTGVPPELADDRVGGYYLFAGLLVVFLIVFRALQLSHVGWAFRALRDDELAAELAGVDVPRYRIYAATIGSAMIGLTGALLAYSAGFISPATYSFDRVDVRVLVLVAFGGLGTLLGPVIGAGVFAVLDDQLTARLQLREVLYGVFIIAIFLGFRRGVVHAVTSLVRRLLEPPSCRTAPSSTLPARRLVRQSAGGRSARRARRHWQGGDCPTRRPAP